MVSSFVHAVGTPVWVADEERTWLKGVVKDVGDVLVVSTENGERRVPPASAPLQNKDGDVVDVRRLLWVAIPSFDLQLKFVVRDSHIRVLSTCFACV